MNKDLLKSLNESLDIRSKLNINASSNEIYEDFDILNSELEEDTINIDRVNVNLEGDVKVKNLDEAVDELPENVELKTLEEVIEAMNGNVSDESLDQQLKMFSEIAKTLGVKNYDELLVAINDGEFDPKYILQDGYPIKTAFGELIHYPSENIVVENFNGQIFIYFVTEKSAKKYFTLANKFLNDFDIDDNTTFAENYSMRDKETILLDRIDDKFEW